MVLADPQLLRQVIVNLTSNAHQVHAEPAATSRSGTRDGRAAPRAGRSPTAGSGSRRRRWARLFEKFYRADNVHTVETEGTGLGLYLVRLIIEQLAGRVWCESEEGRGSTFIFTLPVGG